MRTFFSIVILLVVLASGVRAEVRGYIGANVAGIQPGGQFADTDISNEGGGAKAGFGFGLESGLSARDFELYLAWNVALFNADASTDGYSKAHLEGDWTTQLWTLGGRISVAKISNKRTDITVGAGIFLGKSTADATGSAMYYFSSQPITISDKATSSTAGGSLLEIGVRHSLSQRTLIRGNLQYRHFEPHFNSQYWDGNIKTDLFMLQLGFAYLLKKH